MGRFSTSFSEADAAFSGLYSTEINKLNGLSKEEIKLITPDPTGETKYRELIKVVEVASKDNLSKAELADKIKNLGDIAVEIAKKIPELAAIL